MMIFSNKIFAKTQEHSKSTASSSQPETIILNNQSNRSVFHCTNRIGTYRSMPVWQRGIELVQIVSGIVTNTSSNSSHPCLIELQQAALDIPKYIAQGLAAGGDSHFHYMLENTKRSLASVDTQTFLAYRLNFICYEDKRRIEIIIIEIQHLIHQIQEKLQNS